MYRYIIGSLVIILFVGCAPKSMHLTTQQQYDRTKENDLLFQAIFLEYSNAPDLAAQYYQKLFALHPNPYYMKKAVSNLIRAKRYDHALALLQRAIRKYPKKAEFYSLAARLFFAKKDFNKAKEYALKALKIEKRAKDYELLASLYLLQKDYEKALKYLKSAYSLNPSDHTINSIAYIFYFYLDKPKEAIAYLETHTRIYGCKKNVCKTLASLYGQKNDIEGLISVYKRLYNQYKDPIYAKKLIELYLYQKEYEKAIKYVKILDDEELLLEIYKAKKDYNKALDLAEKLFKSTHNLKFLAQSAIFEYEAAKNKKDPKLLQSVARKLEQVVKRLKDPVYLNYLGYLYIENDMNVERGIKLVKEALQKEPNSPFYLDSLAWGYYKIGKCEEAYRLIKKVYIDMNLKDPEVELHYKMIKKCKEQR